ncbi:hypothetical protein ACVXG7_06215 [Enterobacter hormaechei]
MPGFTGVISDLGGPTANMYMLRCKSPRAEQTCRRLSCVYPSICEHMDTNHEPTINLYRRARDLKGIKNPDRLRRAFEHCGRRSALHQRAGDAPRWRLSEDRPGAHRRRSAVQNDEAGIGSYDRFKQLFDTYSKQAGRAVSDPILHLRTPGTRDEDMVNLALWLKQRRFRLDQVQNFYRRRSPTRRPCITPAKTR